MKMRNLLRNLTSLLCLQNIENEKLSISSKWKYVGIFFKTIVYLNNEILAINALKMTSVG